MFYPNSIESEMKKFYKFLSKKDKKRYGARESQKLGWGRISYVMQLLGCSRNTLIKGLEDLEKIDEQTLNSSRSRKKRGEEKVFCLLKSALMQHF
ncbi:hypothetical protein QUA20_24750 [Microcoleus sp. Pol7_A1]